MPPHLLMSIHGVTFRTSERLHVGPIHLELLRRQRVMLRCESGPAYDGLIDILTGKEDPLTGRVIELERVKVQTDRHLRELGEPGKSIHELLNEMPLPDTLWIGGRRRSSQVVMDRLGLDPRHFRRPLKLEPKEAVDRYWALRFICSNADLLIGREIFELQDEPIRRALKDRWADYPGTVICATQAQPCPGPADTLVVIDADGSVRSEAIPPAPAPPG